MIHLELYDVYFASRCIKKMDGEGAGSAHQASVMNQLEDTSREIQECYER